MKTLEQIEKAALLERLIAMRFRAESAADSLGIGRTTFYRKLKAWGLVAPMRCSIADRRGILAEWKLRIMAALDEIQEPRCACDCCCEEPDYGPVTPPAPGTKEHDLQQVYAKAIKDELNGNGRLSRFLRNF